MRIPAQTDRPRQIFTAKTPQLVVLSVISADAVYFAFNEWELFRVDAAGVPTGGFPLTNANEPKIFHWFIGTLWARGTVLNTDIELSYTPI